MSVTDDLPANDLAPERDEIAAEWCWRLAEGALSATEQEKFDAWLAEEPENRQAFATMTAVWQGSDAIADMPGLLALRGQALDHFDRAGRQRLGWRGRRFAPLAAAAALLAMVMTGWLLMSPRADDYATGVGERRVVALADGSRLSLDASSDVEVAYEEGRRALTLRSGRARFDVARDPLRPFTVRAGGKTVVATGTSFSVELLGGQVRVVLYEGHIEVLEQSGVRGTATPVRLMRRVPAAGAPGLRPGEELVSPLRLASATIAPTDVARSLSWEGGRLSFSDEPLAAAIERVNRYAERPIVIGDAATGRLVVNGVFDADDTRGFVSGVASLFPVRVREEPDRILISRR